MKNFGDKLRKIRELSKKNGPHELEKDVYKVNSPVTNSFDVHDARFGDSFQKWPSFKNTWRK